MLGKKKFQPKLFYNLTIDDLVDEDNIYRQIDQFLNLRFVYKECEKLYGNTGKPSIDPVVFFKLELFGYLENIISDRELIRKASDSLAARYFIGYDIDEKLPWHSTISRTRGLISKETFENIFSKILELCYQTGLIGGKHQSIDSTLVKANASLDSLERKEPKLTIKEYITKTYEENKEEGQLVCVGKGDVEQKSNEGQKPELRIENVIEKSAKKKGGSNQDYESKTDPDSRMASKPGKLSGLYYSTHYSADSKKKVITDVYTTYADRKDSVVLLEVYERAEKRLSELGFTIEGISADKGYCSGKNLRELEQRGVVAFIPTRRHENKKGVINNKEFIYEEEKDVFICPNHKELTFYFYDKREQIKRYRAREEDCLECPLKEKCCPKGKRGSLSRTIYYKEYQRLEQRLQTPAGRRASRIRKVVSEGLFAEAKMYNGLRKFMTKGIEKAQKRSYMIASVQNIKRLLGDMKRKVRIAVQKVADILVEPFLLNKFMFVLITKNNNRVN
ncbi:MAG: hypothetical protein A2315_06965 [Ignavibacteria bacterium RIFOXYB2_FULL_35_12]|nr:MAG: hypothetical protein A2058_08120 [Ignavibacteria bacterium GWA2_36_19]OGU77966.1 MAG: hypothetical protein A2254_12005 [Ignavibacteria bacterium RIFOXYA2_FULL_35_9]OGV02116.1 MAG: hypothetical protein A2315_06965 [Ignavibacteria bacterium RIFOXYB2_FULL_35_12]OGV32335.1 MAG: hypothetical protein A2523_16240 [Ignavibacteria bacterium RIFOXYD12_FULL_36_8]